MHTHFFIFIFIFLGAGLDPASPARSLAQASDPAGKNQRNHACMNSANVIKLPSHSVLATINSKNAKRDEEWAYLLLETAKMLAARWCLSSAYDFSFCFLLLLCHRML
jgi:hypothetical protein